MSATITPELESYRANCIAAAGEVLSEPVIDAAPFNRRGLYTNKLLGHFGFLPYLLGRAHAKAQAGGLPEQFILAVTPTKLTALSYKAHGRKRDRYEAGGELASWDRDAVRVSWQDGPPFQIDVTIEGAAGGEPVLCRGGRTPWTENLLEQLSRPPAA